MFQLEGADFAAPDTNICITRLSSIYHRRGDGENMRTPVCCNTIHNQTSLYYYESVRCARRVIMTKSIYKENPRTKYWPSKYKSMELFGQGCLLVKWIIVTILNPRLALNLADKMVDIIYREDAKQLLFSSQFINILIIWEKILCLKKLVLFVWLILIIEYILYFK